MQPIYTGGGGAKAEPPASYAQHACQTAPCQLPLDDHETTLNTLVLSLMQQTIPTSSSGTALQRFRLHRNFFNRQLDLTNNHGVFAAGGGHKKHHHLVRVSHGDGRTQLRVHGPQHQ